MFRLIFLHLFVGKGCLPSDSVANGMRFISLQPSEQISASSLTTDWHASLRFNSFAVSLSSYVSQGAGYESPFRMIHYLLLEGREGTSCWLWFPINFNQCNKVEFPFAKLIMERESFQGSSLKELIFFFLIISHPKSTLVISTIGNVEKQKKKSPTKSLRYLFWLSAQSVYEILIVIH